MPIQGGAPGVVVWVGRQSMQTKERVSEWLLDDNIYARNELIWNN